MIANSLFKWLQFFSFAVDTVSTLFIGSRKKRTTFLSGCLVLCYIHFLSFRVTSASGADPPPHLNGSNLIPPPSPPPPPPPAFVDGEPLEANVTLLRMEIFDQHAGWLDYSTDVYFRCVGEAQTFIPEVKVVSVNYTFNGSESFQVSSISFFLTPSLSDNCNLLSTNSCFAATDFIGV